MLEGEKCIRDITLAPIEQAGSTRDIRKVIHDAFGESIDNWKVLMEMQDEKRVFIKARNVYYVSANIHEQFAVRIKKAWE